MIRKLIRQMLIAQILSALTVSLCLLIDNIIIGRFLGVESIAAYQLANPILLMMGALGSMLAAGVQVACSKSLGRGSQTETDSGYSYVTNADSKGVTVTGIYSGTGEISVPSEINGLPVTAIGTRAFNGRTAFTKVIIPETVQTIGEEAFRGCSALQTVSIGTGVTSIERYAFYECPKLADVIYQGSEDEWNGVTIGDGNALLTNAHRSIGAQKPLPLSPIRAERAGGDDVLSYNVYVDKVYDNSTIYEAVYDASGRLIAAGKAAMPSTGAANVTAPNAAGAAGVKIFVWKDVHQPVAQVAAPGM